MRQRVTLLGSTGSIGDSTLDVLARHPDRFSVAALTAHQNDVKLAEQCLRFRPECAVIGNPSAAARLAAKLRSAGCPTQVGHGPADLAEAAANGCDTVVAAIVGAAGLAPALAAARAGKRILLANKEALVMSGALFIDAVRQHHATLLPLDSEHNAIYQCLTFPASPAAIHHGVTKITLTASGGPFRGWEPARLVNVTPEQACAHPNWSMGRKVSVDSATMMNKGLEVIEAHWLFGLPPSQIEVLIHPQSVIHSMVSYADGSVLAQLGRPDMRTPIAHALAYPKRIASGVAPLDLAAIATLTFERPDNARFPCLSLAFDALKAGGTASTSLNAANEIAVDAFLARRVRFTAIAPIIDSVLSQIDHRVATSLDDVLAADAQARRLALNAVAAHHAQFSALLA